MSEIDAEEAAIARGRRQLNHMRERTTINKEPTQKFAKRIVSPMKGQDGKIINKAAGDNDIGSMLRSSGRSFTLNSFRDQYSQEEKQGKRILAKERADTYRQANKGTGIDFSALVPERE